MAELAAGAVSSLLGVIRNEALLLDRVRDDVQFIKEEMESMNSFLAHLARTAPPGGEHDEQVRTWMNQVRVLAQDCNNCIDLYLYRGNPDIQRARGGLMHHLWWVPWFVQKMLAQHRAAIQLRQLKERARDVGERRMRYGVVVPDSKKQQQAGPMKAEAPPPPWVGSHAHAPGAGDDEDGDADDQPVAVVPNPAAAGIRGTALFEEGRTLDDYFKRELVSWLDWWRDQVAGGNREQMMSLAVMASGRDQDALALAHQTLAVERAHYFSRRIVVDIPAVHLDSVPLRPKEILYYILRELEHKHSHKQATDDEGQQGGEGHPDLPSPSDVYDGKRELIGKIRANIQEMKAVLGQLKCDLRDNQLKLQQDLEKIKDEEDLKQRPLNVLLQLLLESAAASGAAHQDQVRNKAVRKLGAWYSTIMEATAEKLRMHMEAAGEEAKKKKQASTSLHAILYEHVLQKVFPKPSNSKETQQAQEQEIKQATSTAGGTTTTTMAEDQIKEMINKVTEMLQELQEDKTGEPSGIPEGVLEQKMKELKRGIKDQMKIKWIIDNIEGHFNFSTTLIILRIGEKINGSTWAENRNALSLLGELWWDNLVAGLIITTTRSAEHAKEYCYPRREPIYYSLAGFYNDIVLKLISQQKNENYDPQVLHDMNSA